MVQNQTDSFTDNVTPFDQSGALNQEPAATEKNTGASAQPPPPLPHSNNHTQHDRNQVALFGNAGSAGNFKLK